MKVGFYDNLGSLIGEKEIVLNNERSTEVDCKEFINKGVKAIVPNTGDWTFIKIILDPISLNLMKYNISSIKDELTRSLVWRSLFEMVRDANTIKATEFIDLLLENIPLEKSSYIISNMYLYLDSCIGSFVPEDKYSHYKKKGFQMIYKILQKETNKDSIIKFQSKLVSYCWSPDSLIILSSWLEGNDARLSHCVPNLQEKWAIVTMIFAKKYGTKDYRSKLRASLEEEDKTDMKREYGFRISAITANAKERKELWKEYMDPQSKMSFHMLGKSTMGFNSRLVKYEVREEYFDEYYKNIVGVLKTRQREIGKTLYHALKPEFDDHEKTLSRNEELARHVEELDKYWQKNLLEDFDSDRRRNKVLNFEKNA